MLRDLRLLHAQAMVDAAAGTTFNQCSSGRQNSIVQRHNSTIAFHSDVSISTLRRLPNNWQEWSFFAAPYLLGLQFSFVVSSSIVYPPLPVSWSDPGYMRC